MNTVFDRLAAAKKAKPHGIPEANAKLIADWLAKRGGIKVWESVNLANLGATWTTPATNEDGTPTTKPNWQSANEPARTITDIAEVEVFTAKEVKRFRVGVRMASNSMALKVTDAGTARIRREVAKAKERYGKDAWYTFDYAAEKNAVIMVEDTAIPLADWLQQKGPS